VIWVCILCRKKQEILIKSGSWVRGTSGGGGAAGAAMTGSDPILRRMEEDMRLGVASGSTSSLASTPSAAATAAGHHSYYSLPTGVPAASPSLSMPIHHSTAGLSSFFSRALSLAPAASPAGHVGAASPRGRGGVGVLGGLQRGVSLDRRPSSSLSHFGPLDALFGGHREDQHDPRSPRRGGGGGILRQRSLEGASSFLPFSSIGRRVSSVFTPTVDPSRADQPRQFFSADNSLMGTRRPSMEVAASPLSTPYASQLPPTFPLPSGAAAAGGGLASTMDQTSPWSSTTATRRSRLTHGSSFDGILASRRRRGGSHGVTDHERVQASRPLLGGFYDAAAMSAPEDNFPNRAVEVMSPGGNIQSTNLSALVSDAEARDLCPPMQTSLGEDSPSSLVTSRRLPVTSGGGGGGTPQRNRRMDSSFRTDSLSSDQSEQQQRPPPPRPHKRRTGGSVAGPPGVGAAAGAVGPHPSRPAGSYSSEEDRSTPDHTSEDLESESISEICKSTNISMFKGESENIADILP
jgi:hypothetical protein